MQQRVIYNRKTKVVKDYFLTMMIIDIRAIKLIWKMVQLLKEADRKLVKILQMISLVKAIQTQSIIKEEINLNKEKSKKITLPIY